MGKPLGTRAVRKVDHVLMYVSDPHILFAMH
jgi:hypothetical protein